MQKVVQHFRGLDRLVSRTTSHASLYDRDANISLCEHISVVIV